MADALHKKIKCKVCLKIKMKSRFYDRAEPVRPVCRSCVCLATNYNKGIDATDMAKKASEAIEAASKTRCERTIKNKTRQCSYSEIKTQIFRRLGNKCYRCGEADLLVLQIDHIHGGGTRERKGKGSLERYKIVLGNINRYQILCANCNIRKRWENKE
jgi:hypothetical protein